MLEKYLNQVTSLDFRGYFIEEEGAGVLAKMLEANKKITLLDLGHNPMGVSMKNLRDIAQEKGLSLYMD